MELKHLITFNEVAKTLNFTRAAEALHFAQPTVSAHIQALEQELGVVLFNRLGRQIVLTEAGKKLQAYAEKLTDLAEETRQAVTQIGDELSGNVRIGASETLLTYRLPPILNSFQQQYPTIRLIINPVLYPDLLDAVRKDKIDIALAFREEVDSDLAFSQLMSEQLHLVTSPKHPLVKNEQVTVRDLENGVLLAPSLQCPYRLLFKRILDGHGVNMETNYQFGSIQPIKQFASQNGGIALLAKIATASEIDQGELAQLSWVGPALFIPVVMVWHPKKWESATVRSLKSYLKDHLIGTQS